MPPPTVVRGSTDPAHSSDRRSPGPAKPTKRPWPKTLSEQASAVQNALAALPSGATAKDISKSFGRTTKPREARIEEILETLEALGKARQLDDSRYIAV
jgi:hypothetical protein